MYTNSMNVCEPVPDIPNRRVSPIKSPILIKVLPNPIGKINYQPIWTILWEYANQWVPIWCADMREAFNVAMRARNDTKHHYETAIRQNTVYLKFLGRKLTTNELVIRRLKL